MHEVQKAKYQVTPQDTQLAQYDPLGLSLLVAFLLLFLREE